MLYLCSVTPLPGYNGGKSPAQFYITGRYLLNTNLLASRHKMIDMAHSVKHNEIPVVCFLKCFFCRKGSPGAGEAAYSWSQTSSQSFKPMVLNWEQFASQGTVGSVCKQFWLSQLRVGSGITGHRGQVCC